MICRARRGLRPRGVQVEPFTHCLADRKGTHSSPWQEREVLRGAFSQNPSAALASTGRRKLADSTKDFRWHCRASIGQSRMPQQADSY